MPLMSTFRVLQFNMQFGQIWDDTYPDRAPIRLEVAIEEIGRHRADVILLQEVEQALPMAEHELGVGRLGPLLAAANELALVPASRLHLTSTARRGDDRRRLGSDPERVRSRISDHGRAVRTTGTRRCGRAARSCSSPRTQAM